jgi:hypothetical protein
MKKQLFVLAAAVFVMLGSAQAQGGQGGMQRQTPEERTAAVLAKIDSAFKPTDAVKASVKTIFLDFFNAQQKSMEEMRAAGTMDRDAMMAKRKELMDARDVKLKAVLTEAQMKTWTEQIEPGMRPQRRSN